MDFEASHDALSLAVLLPDPKCETYVSASPASALPYLRCSLPALSLEKKRSFLQERPLENRISIQDILNTQVFRVRQATDAFLQTALAEAGETLARLLAAALRVCETPLIPLAIPRVPSSQGAYRSPLSPYNFAAIIPGDSVGEIVISQGLYNFLNIYNTVLIGRIILTWFPNAPAVIVNPLSSITDPYLNLFRGIIPPLGGGLDFSPILAFLVLNVFTNSAAALPAELPSIPLTPDGGDTQAKGQ